jgi:adenine-specific DNA methylase
MTTATAQETLPAPDLAGATAFIERQLPVSRLSKESYKERKANAGQTLTALGSYWKGRKPLILVRAVVLGLLMPTSEDDRRDREIFLKLMLMDDAGVRKRKAKSVPVERAKLLLPRSLHDEAFEPYRGKERWKRSLEPERRQELELMAFDAMGLDERLTYCVRPEELPESALDDVWPEVNAHLGTDAQSFPELVEQLGMRRFGHRPKVGDPFCGGGSIPFEAARMGCDVYASDLNPIACLLTWGALNIVGGSTETRARIAAAQARIVQAVDTELVRLGIEHDGDEGDLRLPLDAPTRWPHRWRVDRRGEIVEPEVPPYEVTCPQTGWRVPLLETRQVHEPSRTVLDLVPLAGERAYRVRAVQGVDEDEWEAARLGTVVQDRGAFTLAHDPGSGLVEVRIANRAKAYLYCLETECPKTGWRVPMAPSWLISKNYRTCARLRPKHEHKRFAIEILAGASDAELEAAAKSGTVGDRALNYELDGRTHVTSMEAIRGEIRLKRRYRDQDEERRDHERFAAAANKYSETAANELRRWERSDFVPRDGDIFQERLYCIQWSRPDGSFFYAAPTAGDLAREAEVEDIVRRNLAEWQAEGLVPDTPIESGDKTDEPIRTRGWTHWHHLFGPRHLLIGALIRQQMVAAQSTEAMGAALGLCRALTWCSRLTRWNVGFPGSEGVAPSADTVKDILDNKALNPLFNFGARAFPMLSDALFVDTKHFSVDTIKNVKIEPAESIDASSDMLIVDPPYADAIFYDEINDYFISWLKHTPPRRDWNWDSNRKLAIRGHPEVFRRSMVASFRRLASLTAPLGFHLVMFTHQDVGVWADLAEIMWASDLQVTAGWCVITETDKPYSEGNLVQGTVLLVLRKRQGDERGFFSRLQRPVEQAVEEQLLTMRALDDREQPNFGDADYQLAAYAAALKVLTRYAYIDGKPVAAEVLRERAPGETSEIERLLARAVRLASDFLVPAGLARAIWDDAIPEERFFLKGLELEKAGDLRSGAYQELARGFGVEDYRAMLAAARANQVRLKTAAEFGSRDLRRAGSADRAEDRALEGFAGGIVRHVLYGLWQAVETNDLRAALTWFDRQLPNYWQEQQRVVGLLEYLGTIGTAAREGEATKALELAGAVRNHRL